VSDCDPVGIPEIADRLGVKRPTVDAWRQRKGARFPEPRWTVGRGPAWDWPDVKAWAIETNRMPHATAKLCPHGIDVTDTIERCPQCAHDNERAAMAEADSRPLVTLTITEKRRQHVVWSAECDGKQLHSGGPVLSINAAERLAREIIDDKLGKDAYRLEVVHQ
jgi:predicted DNA-binding transcriptional regulator AlpA